MIELNSIRIALGLTWNEFYLCYLVQDQTQHAEFCGLSRVQLADNLGVSKQAIIDLVKKLDRLGYIVNQDSRLKCSDKWSRNFTDAAEFVLPIGKETLPPAIDDGKESLPPASSKGKETLPVMQDEGKESLPVTPDVGKETLPEQGQRVKKLYHYTNDSGKETLPPESSEVKKLYRQQEEIVEQIQENDEKQGEGGKETLPVESSGDLYILNNNLSKEEIDIEKGCGEKQKPYDLVFKDEVATCQVLQAACKKYHEDHPDKYPLAMYTKFIRHWSAPDRKGVPKWYKELTAKKGTWHLPGRLATWHENDLKFNSKSYNGKSNQRGSSALRPTSIAEPSQRVRPGNVAHVEF